MKIETIIATEEHAGYGLNDVYPGDKIEVRVVNSEKWVKDRTTSELLNLCNLLSCLTAPKDMPSNDKRLVRLRQVKAEIAVRQQRQVEFMDRLDASHDS